MTFGLLLVLLTPAPADLPPPPMVPVEAAVQQMGVPDMGSVQDPFAPSAARQRRSQPAPAAVRNCLSDPFASGNRVRAANSRPMRSRSVGPLRPAPRTRAALAPEFWGQGLKDPFTTADLERRARTAPKPPQTIRNPWPQIR